MVKLTLAVIAAVVWFGVWSVRKSRGRQRMLEIDEGKRCVACDGTSLDARRGIARCLRCGHTVSLVTYREAQVSDRELGSVTKPDDNRRGLL
jgi:ribosomal protein L37AE/L43A